MSGHHMMVSGYRQCSRVPELQLTDTARVLAFLASSGGRTWEIQTRNASWSSRDALAAVVLADDMGTLLILGGHDSSPGNAQWHHDVWASLDVG